MPSLVKHDYATPGFAAAEQRGLALVRDCAFVLVAGGLGERLGYTDIKISLPVQSITEQSYIDLYISQILAMQAKSNEAAGGAPVTVPLAIMTSGDTHAKTVALLAANGDFGAAPGQVTLMKQEKVAALTDNDAHFALEGPYELDTKPHGHGDVHTLLASTGLAAAWAKAGKKYVVFFQDTNALCFTVTIAAIGVSAEMDYEINSIAVPRKAKDAVGAITRLERADGSSITVNVEYNQLEPMLLASGFPEGDVNGPDGISPFPGNINQVRGRGSRWGRARRAASPHPPPPSPLPPPHSSSLRCRSTSTCLRARAGSCPSSSTPSTPTRPRPSSRSRRASSA